MMGSSSRVGKETDVRSIASSRLRPPPVARPGGLMTSHPPTSRRPAMSAVGKPPATVGERRGYKRSDRLYSSYAV